VSQIREDVQYYLFGNKSVKSEVIPSQELVSPFQIRESICPRKKKPQKEKCLYPGITQPHNMTTTKNSQAAAGKPARRQPGLAHMLCFSMFLSNIREQNQNPVLSMEKFDS